MPSLKTDEPKLFEANTCTFVSVHMYFHTYLLFILIALSAALMHNCDNNQNLFVRLEGIQLVHLTRKCHIKKFSFTYIRKNVRICNIYCQIK